MGPLLWGILLSSVHGDAVWHSGKWKLPRSVWSPAARQQVQRRRGPTPKELEAEPEPGENVGKEPADVEAALWAAREWDATKTGKGFLPSS